MICDYGCGQTATHFFKSTKKWCCSKSTNSCPGIKKLKKEKNKDLWTVEKRKDHGKKTIERFKNPNERKKQSDRITKYFQQEGSKEKSSKGSLKRFENETIEEKEIRVQNHKDAATSEVRKKQSNSAINRFKNETIEEKESRIQSIKDGWTEENRFYNGIKSKFTISKLKNKYSFFSFIEEMRYEPGKKSFRIIQVHCKNSNCKNSIEQGGWFTPDIESFKRRIYALEKSDGDDGAYLYCSDECKKECCLFNLRFDPIEKNKIDRYRDRVLKETYITTKLYSHKIKNYQLRSKEYHLDHKFSIYEGFKHNIIPKIIAQYKNLEIIPIKLNLEKNSNCSITLQELLSF